MASLSFSEQFKKAVSAGKHRDYAAAVKILESVILNAPDSFFSPPCDDAAKTYLFLGRSWHCLHQPSKALYYFKLYTSLLPDDSAGWFFMARTCYTAGWYRQAFSYVRRSLVCNDSDIPSLQLLGAVNLKLKRSSHARAAFEKGLELDPGNEALQRGYYNALFIDAVKDLRTGKSDQARQMFTFLINNDIDGVVPRLYLGHAFRDLNAYPEALSQYEAAWQFAPEDESLPWYIVSILLQMGEHERAQSLIQQLDMPPALQKMGAGRNIKWSETVVDKMIIQQDLMNGEFSRAAQSSRLYIRKNGPDPVVHCLLGEALRNSGSYDSAINHFMRAIDLDRTNPAPRYGLLLVLINKQDWQTLDKELAKIERTNPDPGLLYYRCIADAKLKKDPAEIASRAQALLREMPGDTSLMLVLAEQYVRIGMPELSHNWYAMVREAEPDNEEAAIGYLASCETDRDDDTLQEAYTYYLSRWGSNHAIRHDYIQWLSDGKKWSAAADNIEILLSNHSCEQSNCTEKITRRILASCRRKAGQYRQAAIIYREILRQVPRDTSSLYSLLYCLDKLGSPDKARELLQAATKFIRLDIELLLVLGLLFVHEHKTEKALDVFRSIITDYPDDWRAYHHVSLIYREEGVTETALQFEQQSLAKKTAAAAHKTKSLAVSKRTAAAKKPSAAAPRKTPRKKGRTL